MGDNGDVGNALQVVATLYDLKTFSPKDLTSTKIVVKTGSNTIGMKQIVDYLEKDVYPIINGCDCIEIKQQSFLEKCWGLGFRIERLKELFKNPNPWSN